MLTQTEILKYLYGLERGGIKPGLERIERLMQALDNPHLSYPCVHIGGTNGKGSTAAMTASILMQAGYRVGLYTSPHLERFNERIRINDKELSNASLVKAALQVKKAAMTMPPTIGSPSFFEFTTAMALQYFKDKAVDIAIIEVGMGGRWDATNIIKPLVSVITTVDIDHCDYLGNSLSLIAAEKAGIIKKGVPVVCGEGKAVALTIIAKAARESDAKLYRLRHDFSMVDAEKGCDYNGIDEEIKALRLGLAGGHQKINAACVLAVIEILKQGAWRISSKAIRDGLRKVRWPARVEVVGRRPLVIIDSAHNPAGARTLAQALTGFRYKRLFLVIGIMGDKDMEGILAPLAPLAHKLILCAPAGTRAARPQVLSCKAERYDKEIIIAPSVRAACKTALRAATAQDAVCVTGSIFTVGEARGPLGRACRRRSGSKR